MKTQNVILFTAYNGAEIVDARPEAEIAYENMRYAEELASKRKQKETKITNRLRKYYPHCFKKGE